MPRSLNASLITELATNKLNQVELVHLGISTGTYYTDHYKDIVFDGDTYISSSLFLGASEINESSEIGVNNLILKFSGADQSIISLFLNNDYMDKTAWVYRAFLDENQAIINNPFLLFDGRIENFNIDEDETSSVVSISIASHWADFEKQKGRKTNTNSQKLHFPNDVGFDFSSQAIQDIRWGRS